MHSNQSFGQSAEQKRRAIELSIQSLKSERKVRKVVTPSGARVRGNFPSLKSTARASYESGLEERVLGVCELAQSVKHFQTHPYVLVFDTGGRRRHYTPDAELTLQTGPALLEIKGNVHLRSPSQIERFLLIDRELKAAGVPFGVILSSDIDNTPLAGAVRALLDDRPQPRWGKKGVVPGPFPGLDESICTAHFVDRWAKVSGEA